MPIKKELRHFYDRVWRTVTRPRILARAGNCCERCRKPNHAHVETYTDSQRELRTGRKEYFMFWRDASAKEPPPWIAHNGKAAAFMPLNLGINRIVKVVLTVAHLNHISGDDRDENLAALCQWCHLTHDLTHHQKSREARKDAARPLLVS